MSVYAMAWAYEQDCPPTEKFVLVTLCDYIRENNQCWPSMDLVAKRTGYTRRTVLNAIASLEKRGLLTAEKRNKDGIKTTSIYRMPIPDVKHLRNDVKMTTPRCENDDTPDVNLTTPRCESDDISDVKEIHINHKEPTISKSTVNKATIKTPDLPDGVSLQTWQDFNRLRKDRRATLTDTALNGIKREADKAGISLQTALEICCERGWQGFRADWHKKEQPPTPPTPPTTPAKEDYEPYARRLREYGIID